MTRGAFFWPEVFVGSMSVIPFTVIRATGAGAAGVAATVFLALVVLAATAVWLAETDCTVCALVGAGSVTAKPTIARVKDKGSLRVKVSSLKRAKIGKSPSEYHKLDATSAGRRWQCEAEMD